MERNEICRVCGAMEGTDAWGTAGDGYDGVCATYGMCARCADARDVYDEENDDTSSGSLNAILIDPFTKTVKAIKINHGLDAMYNVIGCELVDVARIDGENDLWVDDEGLFNSPTHAFLLKGMHQPFVGRGLILAHDDEGESISTTLTVDEIEMSVLWGVVGE